MDFGNVIGGTLSTLAVLPVILDFELLLSEDHYGPVISVLHNPIPTLIICRHNDGTITLVARPEGIPLGSQLTLDLNDPAIKPDMGIDSLLFPPGIFSPLESNSLLGGSWASSCSVNQNRSATSSRDEPWPNLPFPSSRGNDPTVGGTSNNEDHLIGIAGPSNSRPYTGNEDHLIGIAGPSNSRTHSRSYQQAEREIYAARNFEMQAPDNNRLSEGRLAANQLAADDILHGIQQSPVQSVATASTFTHANTNANASRNSRPNRTNRHHNASSRTMAGPSTSAGPSTAMRGSALDPNARPFEITPRHPSDPTPNAMPYEAAPRQPSGPPPNAPTGPATLRGVVPVVRPEQLGSYHCNRCQEKLAQGEGKCYDHKWEDCPQCRQKRQAGDWPWECDGHKR